MDAIEPCLRCGEETAAGAPRFSGRRRIERSPGNALYLCPACDEEIAVARSGKPLTNDQVRRSVEAGSFAAITWGDGGIGGAL